MKVRYQVGIGADGTGCGKAKPVVRSRRHVVPRAHRPQPPAPPRQSMNSRRVFGTSFRFTLVLCTKIVKSAL